MSPGGRSQGGGLPWTGQSGRPANPAIVLYAQVDGGFSIWDPARNYWGKTGDPDTQERQPAYVFSAREVWNSLRSGDTYLCNGLICDWALWQSEGGEAFKQLVAALLAMSPSTEEPLVPGRAEGTPDERGDTTVTWRRQRQHLPELSLLVS